MSPTPARPNLGVELELGLVSEICAPFPHEEFGAAGVEGEGKRDRCVSRPLWGQAGTAVSILLIPPENKWQRGAWNLVCGFQVSVYTCVPGA